MHSEGKWGRAHSHLRAHFSDPLVHVVHEFNPAAIPRDDIDAGRWAHMAGLWPKPIRRSNAWKGDPDRDMSGWLCHMTRGPNTPRDWIDARECIALRNARELAEHLGYADFVGAWPTCLGITYVPKPQHINGDTQLHIEDLPLEGPLQPIPWGSFAHAISQVSEPMAPANAHDYTDAPSCPDVLDLTADIAAEPVVACELDDEQAMPEIESENTCLDMPDFAPVRPRRKGRKHAKRRTCHYRPCDSCTDPSCCPGSFGASKMQIGDA